MSVFIQINDALIDEDSVPDKVPPIPLRYYSKSKAKIPSLLSTL